MRRILLTLLATLALTPPLARAGSVILNNGKTLEGTVSLIDGGGGESNIQLQSPDSPSQTFKFADVRYAVFDGLAGGITLSGGGVPWVRTEIGQTRRAPVAQIAGDKITITEPEIPLHTAPAPKNNRKKPAENAPSLIADNCCFVFQKLDWDGEILARVTISENATARAGLMICEGLDGQGPMALVSRTGHPGGGGGGGASFTRRGARSEEVSPVAASSSNASSWLKLTRSWDSIRALESADGITWTPIGEARIEMDDRKGVYIGVAARGNSSLARITFDNLKLAGRRSLAITPGEADPRLRDVSVMLKDGTILSGMLEALAPSGEGKVRLTQRDERVTLKPGTIARAQFAPMNAEQAQTFLAANVGALTKDGDFLEGDLKDLKNGSVTVSSIAFGLTTMEPGRVLGVVLQPPAAPNAAAPPKPAAEVRLQDGSLVMAAKLTVEKNQLVIDEPLVGPLRFGLEEVISISRK